MSITAIDAGLVPRHRGIWALQAVVAAALGLLNALIVYLRCDELVSIVGALFGRR